MGINKLHTIDNIIFYSIINVNTLIYIKCIYKIKIKVILNAQWYYLHNYIVFTINYNRLLHDL